MNVGDLCGSGGVNGKMSETKPMSKDSEAMTVYDNLIRCLVNPNKRDEWQHMFSRSSGVKMLAEGEAVGRC